MLFLHKSLVLQSVRVNPISWLSDNFSWFFSRIYFLKYEPSNCCKLSINTGYQICIVHCFWNFFKIIQLRDGFTKHKINNSSHEDYCLDILALQVIFNLNTFYTYLSDYFDVVLLAIPFVYNNQIWDRNTYRN